MDSLNIFARPTHGLGKTGMVPIWARWARQCQKFILIARDHVVDISGPARLHYIHADTSVLFWLVVFLYATKCRDGTCLSISHADFAENDPDAATRRGFLFGLQSRRRVLIAA